MEKLMEESSLRRMKIAEPVSLGLKSEGREKKEGTQEKGSNAELEIRERGRRNQTGER